MRDHPQVDGRCSWPACEQSARHKIGEEGPVSMHNMTAYLCCEHMAALHMNCQSYPYGMALRSPFDGFDPSSQDLVAVTPDVARLLTPEVVAALPALLAAVLDVAEWAEPCWFDHHGYCQAHWLAEPPCPWGVLREHREALGEALGGGA